MSLQLEKLVNDFKTRSTKSSFKSTIKFYCEWRKITLEELMESGLKEKEYLESFKKSKDINLKENSKKIVIANVKRFLRFAGVFYKRTARRKRALRYINDKQMLDFLTLTGNTENTKRNANRHLANYCDYREKTPTELIEELQTINKKDLQVCMKEFYDSLTIKSKYKVLSEVKRFYQLIGDYYLVLPKSIRKPRGKLLIGNILVDKKTVKKMLQIADLRDSMIILALFESGINPVDLVSLNYSHLKKHLNLTDPDSINDVVVFVHRRQKTDCDFLACFGKQTLIFMSYWLINVKKELEKIGKKLTDSSPIFTYKKFPFGRLSNTSLSPILREISEKACLEKKLTSSDFRNSFNTRAKKMLKHFDKEIFMGHIGGIERHYDISSIEYFKKEYSKAWKVLFDLSIDSEKIFSLEDKIWQLEKEKTEMQKMIEEIYFLLGDEDMKNKLEMRLREKILSEE